MCYVLAVFIKRYVGDGTAQKTGPKSTAPEENIRDVPLAPLVKEAAVPDPVVRPRHAHAAFENPVSIIRTSRLQVLMVLSLDTGQAPPASRAAISMIPCTSVWSGLRSTRVYIAPPDISFPVSDRRPVILRVAIFWLEAARNAVWPDRLGWDKLWGPLYSMHVNMYQVPCIIRTVIVVGLSRCVLACPQLFACLS